MEWPASMPRSTAASYLGVAPTTFDKIVDTYKVPSFQHFERGDRYYLRADLDAYLAERRRKAVVA